MKNISLSDMLNLRGVTSHIDSKWQQSCSGLWQFVVLIQMQLSFKPKALSIFFVPFLESTSNFEHFGTKMIVIATSFRKLQTVKDLF